MPKVKHENNYQNLILSTFALFPQIGCSHFVLSFIQKDVLFDFSYISVRGYLPPSHNIEKNLSLLWRILGNAVAKGPVFFFNLNEADQDILHPDAELGMQPFRYGFIKRLL
jgi:hypothetical protein